jgi:hypothetical protein
MDEGNKILTPAEKHYASLRKAQQDYWRRKNPDPKPRGRPKKVIQEILKIVEVVQKEVEETPSSKSFK